MFEDWIALTQGNETMLNSARDPHARPDDALKTYKKENMFYEGGVLTTHTKADHIIIKENILLAVHQRSSEIKVEGNSMSKNNNTPLIIISTKYFYCLFNHSLTFCQCTHSYEVNMQSTIICISACTCYGTSTLTLCMAYRSLVKHTVEASCL